MSLPVCSEPVRIARLISAEWVDVQLFITAARNESESKVSEDICDVRNDIPVEASSNASSQSAGVHLFRLRYDSLYKLVFV